MWVVPGPMGTDNSEDREQKKKGGVCVWRRPVFGGCEFGKNHSGGNILLSPHRLPKRDTEKREQKRSEQSFNQETTAGEPS